MTLARAASAQEIVNPSWASMPDGEAMAEAYPGFAATAGFGGDVNLRCSVAPDGTLALCRVNTVVPSGLGFDQAALMLVPGFRLNPQQIDGEATKSSVQFSVRFRMGDMGEGPPWTGAEPSPEHLAAVAAFMREAGMLGSIEEDLEAMDLMVDPERESRLRTMLLQVHREIGGEIDQAAALVLARVLTPGQLDDIQAGGDWPPSPPEHLLAGAADRAEQVTLKGQQRLRQLYCAEFDCPDLAPPPTP
ncbi:MAG: energy transducer TonB [Caulobacterales bacterium]|nr:energy transducer TonB [Caulobacterales bacterium]